MKFLIINFMAYSYQNYVQEQFVNFVQSLQCSIQQHKYNSINDIFLLSLFITLNKSNISHKEVAYFKVTSKILNSINANQINWLISISWQIWQIFYIMVFDETNNSLFEFRGVCRTLPNIFGGTFFAEISISH